MEDLDSRSARTEWVQYSKAEVNVVEREGERRCQLEKMEKMSLYWRKCQCHMYQHSCRSTTDYKGPLLHNEGPGIDYLRSRTKICVTGPKNLCRFTQGFVDETKNKHELLCQDSERGK